MAKKNVSEIERGVGYFMGVITNLMDIVREQEIPFEAIYRLATPAGRKTLESMAHIAWADWQAEQPKPSLQTGSSYRGGPADALPPHHYRIHVSYTQLPGVAALEPKFSGKGSVSSLFDGRPWKRHSSCAKIDETPGERIFRLAEVPEEFLGKRIRDCEDELADYFDKLGERFVIETEAVEFADEDPEAQRKNWILALGSSALFDGGNRCVTMLYAYDRDRFLDDDWVGDVLDDGGRLLLVRK
ncbi:MAG: hypothetical protein NUW08_00830 [Candidatus Uhrbacteria bacterium]|nr:hypothetical protein [Candidatus Uhrbacteria bacterium]